MAHDPDPHRQAWITLGRIEAVLEQAGYIASRRTAVVSTFGRGVQVTVSGYDPEDRPTHATPPASKGEK